MGGVGVYFTVNGVEDCYMENGIIFHELDHMPFDRYEDGVGFIHATGREWFCTSDGHWNIEWEDDALGGDEW